MGVTIWSAVGPTRYINTRTIAYIYEPVRDKKKRGGGKLHGNWNLEKGP